MEYIVSSSEIQVDTQMVVRLGSVMRIHSSMACLGIDEGIIKVIDIRDVVELDDMEDGMRLWIDSLIPSEEYELGINLDPLTKEQVQDLLETPWIQYKYTSNVSGINASDDTYWMPVQTFIEHTTIY